MIIDSPKPETTLRAGRMLAACVSDDGLVLCLTGGLGAGKTAFVKGLAEGFGVDPAVVSSPTFVIANQYSTASGKSMHHVDFYRLESASELEGIGWLDLLAPGAVVAVEWGERFRDEFPRDHLAVRLSRRPVSTGAIANADGFVDAPRRIEVEAWGPCASKVYAAWAAMNGAMNAAMNGDGNGDHES